MLLAPNYIRQAPGKCCCFEAWSRNFLWVFRVAAVFTYIFVHYFTTSLYRISSVLHFLILSDYLIFICKNHIVGIVHSRSIDSISSTLTNAVLNCHVFLYTIVDFGVGSIIYIRAVCFMFVEVSQNIMELNFTIPKIWLKFTQHRNCLANFEPFSSICRILEIFSIRDLWTNFLLAHKLFLLLLFYCFVPYRHWFKRLTSELQGMSLFLVVSYLNV